MKHVFSNSAATGPGGGAAVIESAPSKEEAQKVDLSRALEDRWQRK